MTDGQALIKDSGDGEEWLYTTRAFPAVQHERTLCACPTNTAIPCISTSFNFRPSHLNFKYPTRHLNPTVSHLNHRPAPTMRLTHSSSILLLAISSTVRSQTTPTAPCTTYIEAWDNCCPPVSNSYTATSYTDCQGCALSTTTMGQACDIVRMVSTTSPTKPMQPANYPQMCPTDSPSSTGTTTITLCSESASPGCTKTITSTSPFGCQITLAPTTEIVSTDCGGCALATKMVVNRRLGIGPVCVGGRKTITGSAGTARVTECAKSES